MVVVSDSSAVIFLSKINQLEILRTLFGSVLIPPEVYDELTRETAKLGVTDIHLAASQWLRVQAPLLITLYKGLHPGETAAIALAKELQADFLIMDDKSGRAVAALEHLETIGTIGILERAADLGLLDLAQCFEQLKQQKFYIHPKLLESRLQAFELRRAQRKMDGS